MLTDFRSGELVFRWSGGNSGQRGGGIEQRPMILGCRKSRVRYRRVASCLALRASPSVDLGGMAGRRCELDLLRVLRSALAA